MDKGARVEIVRGRTGTGVVGTVFWIGEDRFNEGSKRFGIHGDDGETYWVSSDDVEASNAKPPEYDGPTLQRGDRVSWSQGEHSGEVFWVGPSKTGPGVRVGVKDEEGESQWFDARQLKLESQGNGAPAQGSPRRAPSAPMGGPPPGPPIDDDDIPPISDDDVPF